jgi:twitching motility two-component system response regulator PilG
MTTDRNFYVDVIGFNATERLLLSSIFGMAARRDPGFLQREATATHPADLYLVDGDDAAAMNEFRAVSARFPAPAVRVGAPDPACGLPTVQRPIQWARLLQSFDEAVLEAPHPALSRSSPGVAARDAVLVVDDNATVRKFMESKLAPYGFRADFAETGEQAVGLTGAKEYTCVFLDVVLPGIDGYQVCKLIKSNKQAVKRTSVVMLTSRSSPFDKLRGSLAGCDEYLTKPVDENRLLEVMGKFLPRAA